METGVGQIVHDPDSATEFPEQMAIGAIADIDEACRYGYEFGRTINREASNIGWNMVYGPVADVNVNPRNPITNIRSIGEDPERASKIIDAIVKGIQHDNRMIATVKHFPGAGMQASDSHFSLEETSASRKEMDEIHLYAFKKSFESGAMATMCNHAIYPMLDPDNIATLSKTVMTDVLRNELSFRGVTITDAMGMAGMTSQESKENIFLGTIRAIAAGCDLILGGVDPANAAAAIAAAAEDGSILTKERLDQAALNIIRVKHWLGLFNGQPRKEIPKEDGWSFARDLAQKSITLIRDNEKLLPVDFKDKKVLVLEPTHPSKRLSFGLYTNTTLIHGIIKESVPQAEFNLFAQDITPEQEEEIFTQAKNADIIIVGTSFRSRSGQVGLLTEGQLKLLKRICEVNKNVIAVISNPYVAAQINFIGTVVCCYSTSKVAVEGAVNVINGSAVATGKLPVTLPDELEAAANIISHD